MWSKSLHGYKQTLFADGYALVGAVYRTIGVFDDAITKKADLFTGLSNVDAEDVCAKTAATEKELRPLQAEIDNMILTSINTLESEKMVLAERLNKKISENDSSLNISKTTVKKK